MDPNLLVTKNLHEVKHWVEPGGHVCGLFWGVFFLLILSSDLVNYAWGNWDTDEETRLGKS